MALQRKSRYQEAVQVEEQATAGYEKSLGPDHAFTLGARADLALSNYHLGRYAAARSMFDQVIAAQRKKLGDTHPAVAGAEINLGLLLAESGDPAAAERVFTDAIAIFEKRFSRDYEGVRVALGGLALAYTDLGRLDEAEAELNEVIAQSNKPGSKESGGFVDRDRLGDVKRLKHDLAGAIALQKDALSASVKEYGENSRYTAIAHQYLGLSLRDSGDDAGAIGEFRSALASFVSYLPHAEHPLAATTRYELGLLLLKRDDTRSEGLRMLAEAADLREKFLGADNPLTRQARLALSQARALSKS
jgi:tetratricopeptide (TPR) repeat protein